MSDIDVMSRSDGRMASAASSFTYVPFGFTSKTQYDANESLIQIRSENFSKVEPEKDNDIWKRPPPDFRPQIFAPKPPKRNSRESMKPENYGTYPGKNKPVKRPERTVIPHMLRPKKPDEGRMILRYHIDRPFTAKKKFVTEGMYKAGEYMNPKPHDFRGVSRLYSVYNEKCPFQTDYCSNIVFPMILLCLKVAQSVIIYSTI
jgi:hypothetical protein